MATKAIVFDAASSGATSASLGASSLTIGHTVGVADTERCLFVWVSIQGTGSTCSGVTYNGVSMTQGGVYSAGNVRAYWFYLANPSTGANNIVVTLSGNAHFTAGGVSYYGVNQTTPMRVLQNFGGTSTDATGDGPTFDNDLLLACFVKNDTTEAPSIATGTSRALTNSTGGSGAVNCYGGAGERVGSGGDSLTIDWTWTLTSREWVLIIASIAPATYLGAQSSITIEATGSNNTGSGTASTLTVNVTLGSGTKRLAILCSAHKAPSTFTANFPKYQNTTSMTVVNTSSVAAGVEMEMYYYLIPDGDTGAKTFDCSWTGSGRRAVCVVVLAGVNTSTPIPNNAVGNGTNTGGIPITVTSSIGQLIIDGFAKVDSGEEPAPGTGQTERESDVTVNATPGNNVWTKSSTKEANGGTTNMSWSWTGAPVPSRQWAGVVAAINPDVFVSKFLPEQLGLSQLAGIH